MHTRPAFTPTRATRVASPGRRGGTLISMVPSSRQSDGADQFGSWGRARKLRIDVTLPISDNDHLCGPAQPLARHRRTLDPAEGFFVLNVPWFASGGLLRRSCPDACVDNPEHRFIFNVNRYHRVAKEPRRLPVTCRPEASPSQRSCDEVDLGRILSGDNSPSGTGHRSMLRGGSQDLLWGDLRRVKKTVRRHFPGPIPSDLA